MRQTARIIALEIQILFYDVVSKSTSCRSVCLSKLNKERFCLVSDGIAMIDERILDFQVFESALQSALSRLKAANQSQDNVRQNRFLIDGLKLPIDATIEEFCDSENRVDFTMTFSSRNGEPANWISMGESALTSLLSKF
jgi:hypothetical protein